MKAILFFAILFSQISFAQDDIGNCLGSGSDAKEKSNILISNLNIDANSETIFCYNIDENKSKVELNEEFKLLAILGLFDDQGCLINANRNASNEHLIRKFLEKNFTSNLQVFASVNPESSQANLIVTNSSDKLFVDNALSTKDKWKIAGFSAGSIAIGALVSENIYAGQADKRGHWMVGAVISGVSTGATYFLLETTGLGDKLGLSKSDKIKLIKFSGPIMGTIAGILKEVYDSKHKDKHTVDINDTYATSLGAGGVSLFSVSFPL